MNKEVWCSNEDCQSEFIHNGNEIIPRKVYCSKDCELEDEKKNNKNKRLHQ